MKKKLVGLFIVFLTVCGFVAAVKGAEVENYYCKDAGDNCKTGFISCDYASGQNCEIRCERAVRIAGYIAGYQVIKHDCGTNSGGGSGAKNGGFEDLPGDYGNWHDPNWL